jgi:hypothetical protein
MMTMQMTVTMTGMSSGIEGTGGNGLYMKKVWGPSMATIIIE